MFLQSMAGSARHEIPINLRLEMFWHTTISRLVEGLLYRMDMMLIVTTTIFLACTLVQLMIALDICGTSKIVDHDD